MSGQIAGSDVHPAGQGPGAQRLSEMGAGGSETFPLDLKAADPGWLYVAVGLGAALYFYLHLWRSLHVVFWYGVDQAIFLEHAQRMLGGEVLYRDLFQFNLPGTEYLYYFLFRLFGVHLWICAAALLVALTGITLAIYSLSRTVLHGVAALIPAIVFLLIDPRSAMDGSHHWYSALCVLLAINLIARAARSLTIVASAGVLLGAATLFTSSRGVFVGLGVSLFFIWNSRSDLRKAIAPLVALLVPLITVVAVPFFYLGSKAGFKVLIESVIIFPLRYYKAGAGNSYSWFIELWHTMFPFRLHSIFVIILAISIIAAVPIVLIAFSARRLRGNVWRRSDPHRERILQLCAFAATSAALAVASAPSAPRLTCAAAFVYILAAAMLQEMALQRFFTAALMLSVTVALVDTVAAQIRSSRQIDGPHGAFAMTDLARSEPLMWIAGRARPGDRSFGDVNVSFLLGLGNPTKIPGGEPDAYTRPEQVNDVVFALKEKRTRFILWHLDLEHRQRPDDNLDPLRSYLAKHYSLSQQYDSGDQILTIDPATEPDVQ
jgi:hypothetical protein